MKFHSPIRFSLISKLLNVSQAEWPRVAGLWFINFFLRISFVIGWTLLTAMFVTRLGIENLPYLLITNAVFIILGTLCYSEIVHRVKKEILLITSAILGAIVLFCSQFFAESYLFFLFLIIAESVFLSQMHIITWLFAEHLFSPLESERTFPVIESAETSGALMGGIIVALAAPYIPVYKFIFIWIFILLLIVPIIFIFSTYINRIPFLQHTRKQKQLTLGTISELGRMTKGARAIWRSPFLKAILVLVLCQWVFTSLIDFQYTKAVNQFVSHHEEKPIVMEESKFSFSLITTKDLYKSPVAQNEPHHAVKLFQSETKLLQSLGTLHILFGASALFIQLFVASHIISVLGIAGTILLFPILMIFSLFGLTLYFGFPSAVITRNNFEIGSILFKNSYHSSFYAIYEKIRSQVKEFFDGLIKPLGAIIGMVILILFARIYEDSKFTLAVTELMAFTALIMIWAGVRFQKYYTQAAKHNLNGNDISEKLEAVEILSQRGHENAVDSLIEHLKDPKESPAVKVHLLSTLGRLCQWETIPSILDCLENRNRKIRKAAIEALIHFRHLKDKFSDQVVLQYRVISSLKKLFKKESSNEIRTQIIKLLVNFNQADVVGFLIEILEGGNSVLKAACIRFCKNFHDINILHYIEPYLSAQDPNLRASAISALWQFEKFRPGLIINLDEMFRSRKKSIKAAAIFAVGEIGYKRKTHSLLECLKSSDKKLVLVSALALAKLENPASLPVLINIYIHSRESTASKIKEELDNCSENIQKTFKKMLTHEISFRINALFHEYNMVNLHECDASALKKLQHYYNLIDEVDEAAKIQSQVMSHDS